MGITILIEFSKLLLPDKASLKEEKYGWFHWVEPTLCGNIYFYKNGTIHNFV